MENNITIIDNILPPELCDELILKYTQRSGASVINAVNELNNHERGRVVEYLNNYLPTIYGCYFNAMFYRWTHLSHVPIHDDGDVGHAITIYLNKDYRTREGGVFLYRLDDKSHWTGVEPIYNRLVHAEGKVDHFVTPVTSERDILSLQLFDII